ncbi:MAG: RDD family protein [Actinobacteria bacterium]|nr:RDD family protein [Actinomycetota bacterium]
MAFQPTHVVPQGGLPAWASPDGSLPPATNLEPGTELAAGEVRGEWMFVTAESGWSGWVDGSGLVAAGAIMTAGPPGAAPPALISGQPDAVVLGGQVWPLASIGQRIGARVLDTIIIFAATMVFVFIGAALFLGGLGSGDSDAFGAGVWFFILTGIVGLAGGILYEALFVSAKGATPGKMMVGIRVAAIETAGNPTFGKAFLRWLIPWVANLLPYAGFLVSILVYLSATWGQNRRGWHDMVASTVVLRSR